MRRRTAELHFLDDRVRAWATLIISTQVKSSGIWLFVAQICVLNSQKCANASLKTSVTQKKHVFGAFLHHTTLFKEIELANLL